MRVLAVLLPGRGHINPVIPLCKALAERGCEIVVATSGCFQQLVEKHGLGFVPIGADYSLERLDQVFPGIHEMEREEANHLVMKSFFLDVWPNSAIPDILKLAESWKPDLIVRDYSEWSGLVAAAKLQVPCVCCNIALHFGDMLYLMLLRKELTKLCKRFGVPTDAHCGLEKNLYIDYFPKQWNFLARCGSLRRIGRCILKGPYRFHRVVGFLLYSCMKLLALLPSRSSERHVHVRPAVFEDVAPIRHPQNLFVNDSWPLVFVTLGTMNTDEYLEVYRFIVSEFIGRPVNLFIVLGSKDSDPGQLGNCPESIRVVPFMSLEEMLDTIERADVMISHAGGSSIAFAALGVPIITLPIWGDEPIISEMLGSFGLGRTLDIRNHRYRRTVYSLPYTDMASLRNGDIYSVFEDVVSTPSYKVNAGRFKAMVEDLPGIAEVVEEVLRFAGGSSSSPNRPLEHTRAACS